jgi:hypothetical protein
VRYYRALCEFRLVTAITALPFSLTSIEGFVFTLGTVAIKVERDSVAVEAYTTSRKVAGSKPDEVNEFFQFT